MEKKTAAALRENDDLKTTRRNYEAQIQQMTEEFVRMNEEISRLETQLEEKEKALEERKEKEPEEKKEEKKKMNVASLMSGFNKLTKMGVKESESRAKEATPHAESHAESHTESTATTEDMFGGLSSTPTKSPSDDLFGGLSSTPQGEGDNLFGGLSSAPESMPEQKTEPAEEDLLNLNAAPAEEEKKKGFGLGSLMKGFGSKGPSTFPPTEVSAREGDEV